MLASTYSDQHAYPPFLNLEGASAAPVVVKSIDVLHYASVVRNTGPYLEFPAVRVEHEPWYAPAFAIRPGGTIAVPKGPGLGITYDPAIWRQAERL